MYTQRRRNLKGLGQDIFKTAGGTTEFWGSAPDVSGASPGFSFTLPDFTLPSIKDFASLAQTGANIYATVTGKTSTPVSGQLVRTASGQYVVPGGVGVPTSIPAGYAAGSAPTPAVAFGLSPAVKNLLIMGGISLGGIFLLSNLMKGKRRR